MHHKERITYILEAGRDLRLDMYFCICSNCSLDMPS